MYRNKSIELKLGTYDEIRSGKGKRIVVKDEKEFKRRFPGKRLGGTGMILAKDKSGNEYGVGYWFPNAGERTKKSGRVTVDAPDGQLSLTRAEYRDFVNYLNTFRVQYFTIQDVKNWLKSRSQRNPAPEEYDDAVLTDEEKEAELRRVFREKKARQQSEYEEHLSKKEGSGREMNPGNMCTRCGFSIVGMPQVEIDGKFYCRNCSIIMRSQKNPRFKPLGGSDWIYSGIQDMVGPIPGGEGAYDCYVVLWQAPDRVGAKYGTHKMFVHEDGESVHFAYGHYYIDAKAAAADFEKRAKEELAWSYKPHTKTYYSGALGKMVTIPEQNPSRPPVDLGKGYFAYIGIDSHGFTTFRVHYGYDMVDNWWERGAIPNAVRTRAYQELLKHPFWNGPPMGVPVHVWKMAKKRCG